MKQIRKLVLLLLCSFFMMGFLTAGTNIISIKGNKILFNESEIKIIGIRTSNALISDSTTQQLIRQLEVFKSYGINSVSVYFMGSRFGDVKGYLPNGDLDPQYADRMGEIISAADSQGMIVLVGCLYWGNSKAKELLGDWTEEIASLAVANTVQWLSENGYYNVLVDPDNEGMAWAKNQWRIEKHIEAAHAVNPNIMMANNARYPVSNADLNIHFGPKEAGKPYISSEATPSTELGGYWGEYSKEVGYYNYIRIGVYSDKVKERQIEATKSDLNKYNGYLLASTWLQAEPGEGIGGPFMKPGGHSKVENIHENVKELHPDAGIKWWLDYIQFNYGPWTPPPSIMENR